MCLDVKERSASPARGGHACVCVDVECFLGSLCAARRSHVLAWIWKSIRGSPDGGGEAMHVCPCACGKVFAAPPAAGVKEARVYKYVEKSSWLPLPEEEGTHVYI